MDTAIALESKIAPRGEQPVPKGGGEVGNSPKPPVAVVAQEASLKKSSQNVQDAATLELSGRQKAVEHSEHEAPSKTPKEQALDLAKSAQQLEQALANTKVKFGVQISEDAAKGPRFQVIDKETGKVVREFPPESFRDALHNAAGSADENGLLVNDAI